jgi:hypothetical protein
VVFQINQTRRCISRARGTASPPGRQARKQRKTQSRAPDTPAGGVTDSHEPDHSTPSKRKSAVRSIFKKQTLAKDFFTLIWLDLP